jgi:hypothetical protein
MKFSVAGTCAVFALALLGSSPLPASAQGPQYACKVQFGDKTGAPPLSAVNTFLSTRALARRSQQGLALDDRDRPVSKPYVDTVLQVSSGVFHLSSRWGNYAVFLSADTSALLQLRQRAWVTATEVVGYLPGGFHLKGPVDNDPKTEAELTPFPQAKTTGSAAYYGATWDQTTLVHGDALHDAGYRGNGMLIAVIDEQFAGSDTHPGFAQLRSSGRVVDTYNFLLRSNTDVYNGPSHGTQVLSAMAGFQPNTFVGAAPEAQYALYATEISGQDQPIELDNLVAAVERADSLGADVVNISLGYNYWDYPVGGGLQFSQLDGHTLFASKALNIAAEKGILTIMSAGNEGNGSWARILAPADADSALTIGSVASNGVPSSTSGTGPNAAGVVKPDVVGMGVLASVYSPASIFQGTGTSFAAPQIAGWAACLWSANKTLSPGAIRRIITSGASRALNPDTKIGYGIPDFSKALKTVGVEMPYKQVGGETIEAFSHDSKGTIRLQLVLPIAQKVAVQLFDRSGRLLDGTEWNAAAGESRYDWLPAFPQAGVGILKLQLAAGSNTRVFRLLLP